MYQANVGEHMDEAVEVNNAAAIRPRLDSMSHMQEKAQGSPMRLLLMQGSVKLSLLSGVLERRRG